jgi:phosphoribosyl 1,2-cyclic phosphate phosphodiesterase
VKLTFLGTGTSFGVPQLGCHCAVCQSTDPRDKRTRVGALVESANGTTILVDTPPELRLQLLAAGVERIDAVLFTHDHADHTHGIDDLRAFTIRQPTPLPMYGPAETIDSLSRKFRYIFDDSIRPLPGTSKPEGRLELVEAGVPFTVGDLRITPARVPHGSATVFAYRIGPLAYITDAKTIPPDALVVLRGAKVVVINALFRTGHPTHFSISEAIAAAREIGAEQTFLTHLTHSIAHAELAAELPTDVAPAYDGLTVEFD